MAVGFEHIGFRALVLANSLEDNINYHKLLSEIGGDACITDCVGEAHEVIKFISGKDLKIDLIIIDCELLDRQPDDFVKALRAYPVLNTTKIILATPPHSDQSNFPNIDVTFSRSVDGDEFKTFVKSLFEREPSLEGASQTTDSRTFGVDIMIAEDNEVNQIVFSEVLSGIGVDFKIAENGEQAVEFWQKYKPAMVFMDVSMPVMNGHEATRAIRKIEAENNMPSTPICAITAHALRGDKEDCFNAGMDDYLSKPESPDMMIAKIYEMLPANHPLSAANQQSNAA